MNEAWMFVCIHLSFLHTHHRFIALCLLYQGSNLLLTKLLIDSVVHLENVLHLLTFADNSTLQVPVPCFERACGPTGSTGIYVTLEQQIFSRRH